jgi:hypothetical protein
MAFWAVYKQGWLKHMPDMIAWYRSYLYRQDTALHEKRMKKLKTLMLVSGMVDALTKDL